MNRAVEGSVKTDAVRCDAFERSVENSGTVLAWDNKLERMLIAPRASRR
jgi:hypothetical protein